MVGIPSRDIWCLKVSILLMPQLFFWSVPSKKIGGPRKLFSFWVQNFVFIFMVLPNTNTNITGVVLKIDVIKVANEYF